MPLQELVWVKTASGALPNHSRLNKQHPEALRTALKRLMDAPALRKRLGEAGREFAQTQLSWDSIAEKHAAFYRKFIG